ncbi:hypothetical protein G9A89_006755 [Geosiphon pyriformis]|nr:hypothetical protein G9A89_006755 [Geosiphon pyriformis]
MLSDHLDHLKINVLVISSLLLIFLIVLSKDFACREPRLMQEKTSSLLKKQKGNPVINFLPDNKSSIIPNSTFPKAQRITPSIIKRIQIYPLERITDFTLLHKLQRAAFIASLTYCLNEDTDEVSPSMLAKAEIIQGKAINFLIRGIDPNDLDNWAFRTFRLESNSKFFEPNGVNGRLEATFSQQMYLAWEKMDEKLKKSLKEMNPYNLIERNKINLIGHSLGGVYAVLAGVKWAINMPDVKFTVYTFGQPRLGDLEFAKTINMLTRKNLGIYRVTLNDDSIPRLPLDNIPQIFHHHQTEYWISRECNCNGDPVVYRCIGTVIDPSTGYVRESRDCNNRYTTPTTLSHNGPYFGHTMDSKIITKWVQIIIESYNEPQRHYHTLRHIDRMLTLIIYDPRKYTDNEERSSKLFQQYANEVQLVKLLVKIKVKAKKKLYLKWSSIQSSSDIEKVSLYISATIRHEMVKVPKTLFLARKPDFEKDIELFLDLDLEVLSWDAADYDKYSEQIRQEYIQYSYKDFAAGRVNILEKFLKRERIYFSDEFYSRRGCETRARENLTREIQRLKGMI